MLGIGRRMIFFNRNNIESAVHDPAIGEWQLLEGDLAVDEPIWTGEAVTGWPGGDGALRPPLFPFQPIAWSTLVEARGQRYRPTMAVTAPQSRKITADEFFALPGEQRHTQLIDGEIVVNAPSMRHQEVLYWIAYELETFRRANPGAGKPGLEADLPAGEFDVYVPDLWWATPARMPGDRFEVMPDLAIEVRSPSTWRFDVGTKKRGYEAAGLPELWLVDTARDRVIVHRRSQPDVATFDVTFEVGPGEVLSTPLLPDLALDVAELFDR